MKMLPKKIKMGLKIFGMCIGLSAMLSCVDASIKKDLPTSTTSDTFPASYQSYIDKLKQIYPNSKFKAVYTGLDWNTVLKHESYEVKKGISLVPSSYSAVWKKDGKNTYMDGNFVIASKGAVAYVIDPRNSLYEKEVFQFEGLSYNENITSQVIEKVIVSSPMVGNYAKKYKNAGEWLDMDLSYAEIIDKVGKEQGVSSVYIASRMIQETSGDIVNNGSINGSHSTYPGIYNFFNIGATPNADGTGSVTNGLKYAKSQGWTTPYLSITGGVQEIKSSYIKYGQDTVYFQKFDVNNPYGNASALMAYQYQTNILAPTSESRISYKAYKKLDMLDTAFTFYVPVYENMPEDPAPYPAGDSAKFVEDNTKVYLDDDIKNGTDVFNIRSSASSELDNIVYTLEEKEGIDSRVIFTRTKKGDGYDWDYVEATIGDTVIKGYVWKEYVKEYVYTKVESVELDKTELTLELEQEYTLIANINPSDARFKDVRWTSQDENIVSVENGKIIAKAIGTTSVTVTTLDGEKTATCTVTVIEKQQNILLDKEEYTVVINEKIKPIVTLKNIEKYELKVLDEEIATAIDGEIHGLKVGETTLEIKGLGTEIVRTVKVTVIEKKVGIILDKEEYLVNINEKVKPIITLINVQNYELKILDENIAIIVEGEIQGLMPGETTLEIKSSETDIIKTAKVVVLEASQESYKIDDSLYLSESKILTKLEPKTLVGDLKAKIQVENLTLVIKDSNDNELKEESYVGTGTTVTFLKLDGTIYEKITIVIYGDVDGDGNIFAADYVKIKNYIMSEGTLSEVSKIAADVSRDDKIFANDYVIIKNYIMGEGTISQ